MRRNTWGGGERIRTQVGIQRRDEIEQILKRTCCETSVTEKVRRGLTMGEGASPGWGTCTGVLTGVGSTNQLAHC